MTTPSAVCLGLLEVGVLLLVLQIIVEGVSGSKPNIIIILADDMGWNDVSFHGSDQIPTPNIDALAYNGIALNSHYVPALCTPSRSSLLTGKYPTSIGMQHLVILAPEPWGLPLEENLLPEHLKRHGYATHAIGKWHLGFHKKVYTPTYRGFDSFFGYYNGYHDYYDHTMEASDGYSPQRGYDMRRNLEVDYSAAGKYSTDLYTEEAVSIIHNHNSTQGPLFLYLAHLAPHTGNADKPYQAPDKEIAKFSYIKDPERRVYAAMVSKLDESVGQVMTALRTSGKLDNSVVLFMSDNGAVTFGVHSNHGSNYPLRGMKETPWEGGVRGVAAVWSPLLNRTRRVSNQIMHVSDWLPTLFSAAGLDCSELGEIDGKDMWDSLSHDLQSPRNEVFNNYDEIENYSSLRVGFWKYVSGTVVDVEGDGWFGDTGEEDSPPPYDWKKVLNSQTNIAINGLLTDQQLRAYYNPDVKVAELLSTTEMAKLRKEAIISCSRHRKEPLSYIYPFWHNHTNSTDLPDPVFDNTPIIEEIEEKLKRIHQYALKNSQQSHKLSNLENFHCDPLKTVCLFNLEVDPCEELNLAHLYPNIVNKLEQRLENLKATIVKPLNQPADTLSNPALYNQTWTHWCDAENGPVIDTQEYLFLFSPNTVVIVLDNVLVKLITVPVSTIISVVAQTVMSLLQRLIYFVTFVILAVIALLLLTYAKQFVEPIENSRSNKLFS